MPKMNLSHFEASFLFALFTSLVLGIVYGAQCFGYFLLALFGLGRVMKLGHG